ncbi:MAG: Mbeg1-like protein [Eubacterium sp.]
MAALLFAVNCSLIKKGLRQLLRDDAPGFPKYFFDRYDYCQIKDKIHFFTPQGSIIGRMLFHDTEPAIVHSENSGLKQHQVSSWEVDGDRFKYEGKI